MNINSKFYVASLAFLGLSIISVILARLFQNIIWWVQWFIVASFLSYGILFTFLLSMEGNKSRKVESPQEHPMVLPAWIIISGFLLLFFLSITILNMNTKDFIPFRIAMTFIGISLLTFVYAIVSLLEKYRARRYEQTLLTDFSNDLHHRGSRNHDT